LQAITPVEGCTDNSDSQKENRNSMKTSCRSEHWIPEEIDAMVSL